MDFIKDSLKKFSAICENDEVKLNIFNVELIKPTIILINN